MAHIPGATQRSVHSCHIQLLSAIWYLRLHSTICPLICSGAPGAACQISELLGYPMTRMRYVGHRLGANQRRLVVQLTNAPSAAVIAGSSIYRSEPLSTLRVDPDMVVGLLQLATKSYSDECKQLDIGPVQKLRRRTISWNASRT